MTKDRRYAVIKIDTRFLEEMLGKGWGFGEQVRPTVLRPDLRIVAVREGMNYVGLMTLDLLCHSETFDPVDGEIPIIPIECTITTPEDR